jgi:hypothetical protein
MTWRYEAEDKIFTYSTGRHQLLQLVSILSMTQRRLREDYLVYGYIFPGMMKA